jgi:hypothetical protein
MAVKFAEDDRFLKDSIMRSVSPPAHDGTFRVAACTVAILATLGAGPICDDIRCSCMAVQDLAEALWGADAVFVGTVQAVTERPRGEAGELPLSESIVHFRVVGKWKGEIGKTVRLSTGVSDADCGFPFERGQSYLVFASGEIENLSTGVCTRTTRLARAVDDLRSLGPIAEPIGSDP